MDIPSLTRDIVLLIIGGLVTYFSTLAINRTQNPKLSLSWRLLPPVFFPSEKISSFNLSVENDGSKDIENARVAINFPENTGIASFEVQVSEKAAKYEITRSEKSNEIVVVFPVFYKDLECMFAFLVKDLNPSDIEISIVGKDVLGKKKATEYSKEQLRSKKFRQTASLILGVLTSVYIGLIAYMLLINLAATNYTQQLDIAQIYFDSGKPELAIEVLEEVSHYWWVPSSTQADYLLAKAYANKGDVDSVIFYLRRIAENKVDVIQLAKTDKSFDPIRTHPAFIEFMNEFN